MRIFYLFILAGHMILMYFCGCFDLGYKFEGSFETGGKRTGVYELAGEHFVRNEHLIFRKFEPYMSRWNDKLDKTEPYNFARLFFCVWLWLAFIKINAEMLALKIGAKQGFLKTVFNMVFKANKSKGELI